MRKYSYKDSVIEIDPRYLEEGVRVAEEEQFESIRIKGFVDDVDFKCDLDLAPLKYTYSIITEGGTNKIVTASPSK
ncbi:hypothetical protein ACQKNB_16615 [Lysinibacillus xylanilyticus]|uniref:hypothetical protein n=1 Tax=Lysinibacillus xylanilyticus TaxID=582475 RepID=UPI003D0350A4